MKEMKYRLDRLVTQANDLIRSNQPPLSVLEAKLVRLAIAQIFQGDKELHTYRCKIVDLADFLGLPKGNIYRSIDEITTMLMQKVIILRKPDGNYKKLHWVDRIEYENGTLEIKLSEDLKPYLIEFNELFTRYGYEIVAELPTNNAIRLFEILSSWEAALIQKNYINPYPEIELKKNEIIFGIDDLRTYFDCMDKYANTGDFLKRIIAPALKAITESKTCFMKLNCRKIRRKNAITHVVFEFLNRNYLNN